MADGRVWERDRLLSCVRARYIARSVWAVFTTFGVDHSLEGDWEAGTYLDSDGCGNHVLIVWDAAGAVLLAFDHDSPYSEWSLPLEERNPAAHLEDLPPALKSLADIASGMMDRLATCGTWATRVARLSDRVPRLLKGYDATPAEALASWAENLSLSESVVSCVLALTEASAAGPCTITEKDDAVLLAASEETEGLEPEVIGTRTAMKLLEKVGISWPGADERVAKRQ